MDERDTIADRTEPSVGFADVLESLRELHDFAQPLMSHRYRERSIAAFARAEELLEQFGA